MSPDEARRIAALNLEGIGFRTEDRRFYPNRELAAHLLGYVGVDNQGLGGIEWTYDAEIRGREGQVLIQTDERGRAFSRIERPPTAGDTLELTIDTYLQHIAERELRAGVRANDAHGGTIVMLNPETGEVLALANEPIFNPNVFARSPASHRRNRAVQDIYEPGSAFKVVTASAALEENVMKPDDLIDVSAGMIRFGARRIEDDHQYETLSFADVIVKSSNVGVIKIGLQLGPERLERYVYRFGFGQALSTDFPGQSRGLVHDLSRLDDSSLASVAMGYQIGVTPLQMATAVSAVANGGDLLEPRLVRAVLRHDVRIEIPRRVVRRVISADTAAELTTIMEAVVERGTALRAQVPGHTVAGKTGTAKKVVDGRYSNSEYQRLLPRLRPLSQSRSHDPGRDRHAPCQRPLRRDGGRTHLQSGGGGRAAVPRGPSDNRSRSARAAVEPGSHRARPAAGVGAYDSRADFGRGAGPRAGSDARPAGDERPRGAPCAGPRRPDRTAHRRWGRHRPEPTG